MSSTGTVSRKVILPTSKMAEDSRQIDSQISSFPGAHEGVRQVFGTISEVHKEKPMIRAYGDEGDVIAGNQFIPLIHSPSEIIERWGTVRSGMRVLVSFTGPGGNRSNAMIVGLESEKNLNTPYFENEIAQGLYKVFAPGVGIG